MAKNKLSLKSNLTKAIEINREIKLLEEKLAPLKQRIREEAETIMSLREAGEDKHAPVEFETLDGVVTVVFVKDKLDLTKEGDPEALRSLLPGVTWNALFELKPVIRKTADVIVKSLPVKTKAIVAKHLQFTEQNPRVCLPK